MIVRSIRDEIICEYKEVCRYYDCNSKTSNCPSCKKNKYKSPREMKNSYYEPKISEISVFIVGMLIIMILVLCGVYL